MSTFQVLHRPPRDTELFGQPHKCHVLWTPSLSLQTRQDCRMCHCRRKSSSNPNQKPALSHWHALSRLRAASTAIALYHALRKTTKFRQHVSSLSLRVEYGRLGSGARWLRYDNHVHVDDIPFFCHRKSPSEMFEVLVCVSFRYWLSYVVPAFC